MAGPPTVLLLNDVHFTAFRKSGSREIQPGTPARENSLAVPFSGAKDGRVEHHVSCRSKATREIRVSSVVADRAIAEVYTDSESSVESRTLLVVPREDFSGAVGSEEFVLSREIENGAFVQSIDATGTNGSREAGKAATESYVSKSWKDKLREDSRKNHWWADAAGSGRLCMAEEIVSKIHSFVGVRPSKLSHLLAPFAGKVSLRVATLVFRRLPEKSVPLEFYSWFKEHHPELDVSLPTYNALVQCLLRGRQWVGVETVVREMGKKGQFANGRLYQHIIKAASNAGNPKIAVRWLQKLLANEGLSPPPLSTWNAVLACCARDGNFSEAFSVHEQLKAHGFVTDRITYCALLSACRNAGKVKEAEEILCEMKSRGMQPNRIVYSVLVDLYGKAGMPDYAAAVFKEMENAGYQPDQVAYNTLIHAFVKSGMIDDASRAFDRALNLGGHIDPVIFSTMINMYSKAGLVVRAEGVLQIMEKYKFEGNHYQYAYTILINAYARVGQFREAVRLFDKLQTAGHHVSDRIFTAMLNVYFKVGRLRCAEELFQEMTGRLKCRNIVAFGTMINIYGRVGRLEDAVRVFDCLKASGFRGNTVIYNTLIYCQGKNGNLHAVEQYVNEMKSARVELDRVTYSSLIKAYNKSGKPCDAIRLYNEMRSAGVTLDKVVVGTMVNTFGKLKRYEELVQLLENTSVERVVPDERLLRSVIDVYDTTQLEDCPPGTFRRIEIGNLISRDFLCSFTSKEEVPKTRVYFKPPGAQVKIWSRSNLIGCWMMKLVPGIVPVLLTYCRQLEETIGTTSPVMQIVMNETLPPKFQKLFGKQIFCFLSID
ncbi:hypothetical protein R1flu_013711 [Riccia fluitans]|uniref:Pentatricopeptide repeat-containing protein-mitochondrial domain-containing protein n=1 Tax=Riccia fluitans TaxID=41844 RepID=A0ABD1YED6_9MARC